MKIQDWADEDRPREKLLRLGVSELTNAELFAVLISSGTRNETAVDLMKRILSDVNNNITALSHLSVEELCCYVGIGEAKAIAIKAACELGKRRMEERALERRQFTSSKDLYSFFLSKMHGCSTEEVWVLYLTNALELIKAVKHFQGGLTQSVIDVRQIMKEVLLCDATVIAMAHNHPGGQLLPSREDNNITMKLKSVCELHNINFIDHIIVTDRGYYSYRDERQL